ncbi:MAG: hypothetical protein FWE63_04910 [Bacteroidales bacterium]|nr:hypothetical protein [Bacteroidales bacterium]
MRKVIIFIILLSSACRISGQYTKDPSIAVQLSNSVDETRMQVTFYAENSDFCEYYVQTSFYHSPFTIGRGRRQIHSYKAQAGARDHFFRYTYVMYRGNVNKLPNSNFAYRLPVAEGDSLYSEITENIFGYQLKFTIFNDTIYACRGGVVCNDNLRDFSAKGYQTFNSSRTFSQITVYHADCSFGEYVFLGKSLVNPGKTVKMGDPIAIIQKNTDDKDWVLFSTYFLDRNKVRDHTHGNKHTHFRPFFQTSNHGKTRLENNIYYFCNQTDEMLMQDMNKRERKNFLKNKSK